MATYTVFYYAFPNGDMPVKRFLQKLGNEARAKCFDYIDLLEEQGLDLRQSYLAEVESNIWELRPEWKGVGYRLLLTAIDHSFIMVHAVISDGIKLRPRDLPTARRRVQEVQEYYAAFTHRAGS